MKIKISFVLLLVFVVATAGIGVSTFLLGKLPQEVMWGMLFVLGMAIVFNRIAIENQQMFSDEFTKSFSKIKQQEEETTKRITKEDLKEVMEIVNTEIKKGEDMITIADSLVNKGYPAEVVKWAIGQIQVDVPPKQVLKKEKKNVKKK